MIKRVFKLKNIFRGLSHQIDLKKLQIEDGVKMLVDEETNALKLTYKRDREEEYIILVPGDPSFVVMKISKKSLGAIFNAFRELVKARILEEALEEEVTCIVEVYLLLDKITKEQLKMTIREIIEKEVVKVIEAVRDEDFLIEFLPHLKTIVPRVAARKILKKINLSEKVRKCFSYDELEKIFVEELVIGDAESFTWRFIKKFIKFMPSKA